MMLLSYIALWILWALVCLVVGGGLFALFAAAVVPMRDEDGEFWRAEEL